MGDAAELSSGTIVDADTGKDLRGYLLLQILLCLGFIFKSDSERANVSFARAGIY